MQICTETPLSSETELMSSGSERLPSEEVNLPKVSGNQSHDDITSDWFPLVTNKTPSPLSESVEDVHDSWRGDKSINNNPSLHLNINDRPKPRSARAQQQSSRSQSSRATYRCPTEYFKVVQSAKACAPAWRPKRRMNGLATCPSTNKHFTFENRMVQQNGTQNWAQLIRQDRFRHSNVQRPMSGQRSSKSNLWENSPNAAQWTQGSPFYANAARSTGAQYDVNQNGWRRSLSDAWGPMPMTPASPLSPSCSQMGYVPPSIDVMNYISHLNKIDMSPKNPDAIVMNTPTGQFIKSPHGQWFPVQPNQKPQNLDPKIRQQALRETARQKKKQAEQEFGNWCKNRQKRSEFSAAIRKVAQEPDRFGRPNE